MPIVVKAVTFDKYFYEFHVGHITLLKTYLTSEIMEGKF
jgi:hypothetical protein